LPWRCSSDGGGDTAGRYRDLGYASRPAEPGHERDREQWDLLDRAEGTPAAHIEHNPQPVRPEAPERQADEDESGNGDPPGSAALLVQLLAAVPPKAGFDLLTEWAYVRRYDTNQACLDSLPGFLDH
jgi:hypothetical protein